MEVVLLTKTWDGFPEYLCNWGGGGGKLGRSLPVYKVPLLDTYSRLMNIATPLPRTKTSKDLRGDPG